MPQEPKKKPGLIRREEEFNRANEESLRQGYFGSLFGNPEYDVNKHRVADRNKKVAQNALDRQREAMRILVRKRKGRS